MAHILFVHGMNVERRDRKLFEKKWFEALTQNLQKAFPERADSLPTPADCSLLYWTDLLPPEESWPGETKGLLSYVADVSADGARALLRTMADHTSFDPEKVRIWHEAIRKRLEQTVLYMSNRGHLQDHVQERFTELLAHEPNIVIGHSLGSVIAYQGLLGNAHSVDLFMTVGSPLGTPKLVYDQLKQHDWPGVQRWLNYSAVADVWSVPTPDLEPLFNGKVEDIKVRHGSLFDLSTHRLDKYLEHHELLSELERAWQKAPKRS